MGGGAPSTMLRMVPLPRFAGEDPKLRPAATQAPPTFTGGPKDGQGKRLAPVGTAEGGGGGAPRAPRPSLTPR
jgi:hypothetical protein